MSWVAVGGAAITAGGSYLSSKKQKGPSQSTQNTVSPWLEGASQDAVSQAQQIASRQYTPFSGQRVAGLSRNEQQAQEMAGRFGRRTDEQMRGGFQGSNLAQFENPYLDRVLTQRKRGIGEEFGRQSAALDANQAATDAFRSGRSDLARSRLNRDRMRALDEAENETRSAGFDRAMASYFQNENQMQGAFDRSRDALMQTGVNERGIRQAENDFDYGQFLERRDWSVNNLTPLLQAIGAARGQTGSTTTMQPGSKDYWGAAAGLLGTAITTLGTNRGGGTGGSGDSSAVSAFNNSITASNFGK